ncbi:MAG: UDP-N-acetylglucosamine 1-carboxyvinyltransferase [Ruminococcaceae bacterium]|nr:UDP-N-acetylglucosamine 1-carboxyvinyltransferase [Oscillospiraceae bacterium]
MDKLMIRGGNPLYGEVNISGMKNSALPVIFGTIATGDLCTIGNVPDVSDISLALETLRSLGAKVRFVNTDTVLIDTREVVMKSPPREFVGKMRGSTYLIGAMLGRFGEALVGYPGGCDFGVRPIDQHIKGFEYLGATVAYSDDANLHVVAQNGLKGNMIYFDIASVGATINVMLAAVFAEGTTVIENAAREPHIVDMASFLNACGADISGAGTGMIRVRGVKKLHGCTYEIAPDMIEAGTYMAAAATAGGRVTLRRVIPKHMESVTLKLREIGVTVESDDLSITVTSDRTYRSTHIKTNPYPGFPTDMHPQFGAMLCTSQGISSISEGIWGNRFKYVEELKKMGADIDVVNGTAHITGVPTLKGAAVKASDLRAGAALIIAALGAEGVSTVSGLEFVDRGYQDLVAKLKSLGADIRRI